MKQITIVSGKGGTGKTTITASFSALARNLVIADCDVDAPDLHILLSPKVISEREFKGSKLAVIETEKCTRCNLCEGSCRFGAIKDVKIDPILCEGCGVCVYICPTRAIRLVEKVSGRIFTSETRFGPMSHARLDSGETNSGKLVTLVRANAVALAKKNGLDLILIDGPPGIGCPVIASLTGVSLVVIVTEPTMSGIHDLKRALSLAKHFKVTPTVLINMHDINKEKIVELEKYCEEKKIEIIGKIPFDLDITRAMVKRRTIVEYAPESEVSKELRRAWCHIQKIINLSQN